MVETLLSETEQLLGKKYEDVVDELTEKGYTVRITVKEGKRRACTRDYRLDRVNVEIEGGFVTAAYIG